MGDYITVEELRDHLGGEAVEDDTLLSAYISEAELWFEEQTGTVFDASSNSDRTFDGKGDHIDGQTLYVDKWLYSVNEITNGDDATLSTYQLLPKTGPPYHAIKIRSDQSDAWTYGDYYEDAITINGAWGYMAAADAKVKGIIKRIAALMYRRRQASESFENRPILTGEGVTILPAQMPSDIVEAVNFYKAPRYE